MKGENLIKFAAKKTLESPSREGSPVVVNATVGAIAVDSMASRSPIFTQE